MSIDKVNVGETRPYDECHVMLFERGSTLNTGTMETEHTRRDLRRI
jgi:hypothetical protein